MKINTITCHDVYNYGASLQAYALQKYLMKLGHNVEIIDYKPEYLSRHYRLNVIGNPIYDYPIVRHLYMLAKLPSYLVSLRRKHLFDAFTREYLNCTSYRYTSNAELKDNPPIADLYIAGSDQIWNTYFPNGKDAAFYLDFVPKNRKKVSYAASFATDKIYDGYESFVAEKIKDLDCVSIRERSSLPLLASLGIDKAVSVCDPVFLLNKKDWQELSERARIDCPESYVLIYDFERNKSIVDIAKRVAGTNKKVLVLGASYHNYGDNISNKVGPLEFLRLIRNANFVISNSFHATAFSLIFGVNFCVVNRSEHINERMKSLLQDFGMNERLVSSFEDFLLNPIKESDVETYVKSSKLFLNQVLSL